MNPHPKLDFSLLRGLSRRSFLRRSGLIAAITPAAAFLLGGSEDLSAAALPFPEGSVELDIAILNFALNLEYLEGEYYTRGVTGAGLAANGINTAPSGTAGAVTAKPNPAVPFQSAVLASYAAEIAQDEQNHIKYIQDVIGSLGGTPVSAPDIDLLNSFNTVAASAGIADTFDPYADETSFFLGGYSLTDVGVTAYLGAGPLITNKAVLSGASGILAVEAYHDSTLRVSIYQAGADAQGKAQKVSDLRDKLDDNGKKDKDQGVTNPDGSPNIVPTDANSLAFPRTTRQVLNIVYGSFKGAKGGFFPNALNGDIK